MTQNYVVEEKNYLYFFFKKNCGSAAEFDWCNYLFWDWSCVANTVYLVAFLSNNFSFKSLKSIIQGGSKLPAGYREKELKFDTKLWGDW